jgi:hypothetical protein
MSFRDAREQLDAIYASAEAPLRACFCPATSHHEARRTPPDCVDETYVKVSGRWTYLYRAVDQYGQVIDVYLSKRRDLLAARTFFTRALAVGVTPSEVTTDRAAANARVLEEHVPSALHVVEQYANNPIEADHSRLKAWLRPMRGLKRFRSARTLAEGTLSCRTCAAATTKLPPTSLPIRGCLLPSPSSHSQSEPVGVAATRRSRSANATAPVPQPIRRGTTRTVEWGWPALGRGAGRSTVITLQPTVDTSTLDRLTWSLRRLLIASAVTGCLVPFRMRRP